MNILPRSVTETVFTVVMILLGLVVYSVRRARSPAAAREERAPALPRPLPVRS